MSSGIGASEIVGTAVTEGKHGGALGGGGQQRVANTGAAGGTLGGSICGTLDGSMGEAWVIGKTPDTNDHAEGDDSQPQGATQRTHVAYALGWRPSIRRFMSAGRTPAGVTWTKRCATIVT